MVSHNKIICLEGIKSALKHRTSACIQKEVTIFITLHGVLCNRGAFGNNAAVCGAGGNNL